MPRATRSGTIDGRLVAGGLVDLGLNKTQREAGPDGHDVDGFSTRQHQDENGTLVVIVGAYGRNWLRTLAEITGRLESPHIKCTVIGDAPGLDDHEVLVRWSTSTELQARRAAAAQRQAGLREQLRKQQAEEHHRALQDAGQCGLF